eukprot:COSAG03_NODE_118_length_12325_cov_11.481515_1_plen_31_part_10
MRHCEAWGVAPIVSAIACGLLPSTCAATVIR